MLRTVTRFLQYVDLDTLSEDFDHWCYVEADSDEHIVEGRPVGSLCSDSPEQCLDKTRAAVAELIGGTAWNVADMRRWQQSEKLVSRAFFLIAGK